MSFLRNAQQKIAHNTIAPSLIGNADLKELQSLITAEKELIKTNTKQAGDWGKIAESCRAWGSTEEEDLRVSSSPVVPAQRVPIWLLISSLHDRM